MTDAAPWSRSMAATGVPTMLLSPSTTQLLPCSRAACRVAVLSRQPLHPMHERHGTPSREASSRNACKTEAAYYVLSSVAYAPCLLGNTTHPERKMMGCHATPTLTSMFDRRNSSTTPRGVAGTKRTPRPRINIRLPQGASSTPKHVRHFGFHTSKQTDNGRAW